MTVTCIRCGRTGDTPPPHRIGFAPALKEKVLASVCAECWKEWEGLEVKVINEYRLSFLDPEHRKMLETTASEFLFGNTGG